MGVSFHCIQVKDRLVTGRQLPHDIGEVLRKDVHIWIVIGNRMHGFVEKGQVGLIMAVLLEIIDRGIDHNSADPGAELTFKLKLVNVAEYLDEPFLHHVLCVHCRLGIPVADGQHLLGELIVELTLGFRSSFQAFFYQPMRIHVVIYFYLTIAGHDSLHGNFKHCPTFDGMQESLSARDKKVIWHPYTHQKYNPPPIPIVKGEGAWLIGEDGRRYLDAVSSWWVTIHGHAHPYIAERIFEQALKLEQVIFTGFTHQPAVELAERLLAILPNQFSKVFYSDNGSTSTEVAIKMAVQYWWNKGDTKRTRIIALANSYHGDTFGAMSISERGIFTLAFQDRLFDVLFAETPQPGGTISFRGYNKEESARLLEEAACVIYEPLLQGAAGMHMYEPEALDRFLEQCRQHHIICIADEVLTGFGRTGKLFASEYCTQRPDIICLSKGLTGGTMALGVTACTEQVYSAFVQDDKLKSLFHGHSFTANPIACSAALASMDLILKETCMQSIERIGAEQEAFCRKISGRKNVRNIRRCGTIMAFELAGDTGNYISDVREMVTEKALKNGVYLRPLGNTVYIMPPYCITAEELEKVHAVLENILDEINF